MKKDDDVANEGSSGDTFPVMTVEEEKPSATTEPSAPGFFTYYWNRFAEWWWPVKVESGPVASESGHPPVLHSDDETLMFSEDESAKEISLFGGGASSSSSASSLSKSSSSGEEKAGMRKMSYRNALEIGEEEAPADDNKQETMPEDPFERRAEMAVAVLEKDNRVQTELDEFLEVFSN